MIGVGKHPVLVFLAIGKHRGGHVSPAWAGRGYLLYPWAEHPRAPWVSSPSQLELRSAVAFDWGEQYRLKGLDYLFVLRCCEG